MDNKPFILSKARCIELGYECPDIFGRVEDKSNDKSEKVIIETEKVCSVAEWHDDELINSSVENIIVEPDLNRKQELPGTSKDEEAKEIDASINSHSPFEYKLRKLTLTKPDYSSLLHKQHFSRIELDPRLQRYLNETPITTGIIPSAAKSSSNVEFNLKDEPCKEKQLSVEEEPQQKYYLDRHFNHFHIDNISF